MSFANRHIGPGPAEQREMLKTLGVTSLDTLVSQAVPQSIRLEKPLDLPEPVSEQDALAELSAMMERNVVAKSFIGQGYHGTYP